MQDELHMLYCHSFILLVLKMVCWYSQGYEFQQMLRVTAMVIVFALSNTTSDGWSLGSFWKGSNGTYFWFPKKIIHKAFSIELIKYFFFLSYLVHNRRFQPRDMKKHFMKKHFNQTEKCAKTFIVIIDLIIQSCVKSLALVKLSAIPVQL